MNEQSAAQITPGGNTQGLPDAFNADEWHALQTFRASYHPGLDLFTPRELAHLRFVRWLYESRRASTPPLQDG